MNRNCELQFKCLAVAGGSQGLRRVRMAGAEGVDGGGRGVSRLGTAGPGVLRATLGLAKEGSPRLTFPSVLGVPPTPQLSTDIAGGGQYSRPREN